MKKYIKYFNYILCWIFVLCQLSLYNIASKGTFFDICDYGLGDMVLEIIGYISIHNTLKRHLLDE